MIQQIKAQDLKPEALRKWVQALPKDVAQAVGVPGEREAEDIEQFCASLSSLPEDDWPQFFESNVKILHALGRVGRVRLLSRLAKEHYFDFPDAIATILARQDDDGEERQSGSLFGDDLETLIVEAFFPRMSDLLANKENVEAIRSAALTMETLAPEIQQKLK